MFETGSIYLSRGVNSAVLKDRQTASDLNSALERYLVKDWGDLCPEDKESNETALLDGGRLLAKYATNSGDIYIITEADRSATIAMFCDEY